jgi:hypothetical protein
MEAGNIGIIFGRIWLALAVGKLKLSVPPKEEQNGRSRTVLSTTSLAFSPLEDNSIHTLDGRTSFKATAYNSEREVRGKQRNSV